MQRASEYNWRGARDPGSVRDHPGVRPSSAYSDSVNGYSWFTGEIDEFEAPEFLLPPPPQEQEDPELLPPPPRELLDELRALSIRSISSASSIRSLERPQAAIAAPVVHEREPPSSCPLPPYRPNRPGAWFAAVANVVRIKRVTDQQDMLAFMLPYFGEQQLLQIDDILEMDPAPRDVYFRVRDRLVASHSLDDFQRLELLKELPPLGGQKPSALLAEMRQLCPAGEENGLFFRSAFLERLPREVRMHLAEDRRSPVTALAARADAFMVHHTNKMVAAAAELEPRDPEAVAAVSGGRARFDSKKTKPAGGKGGDKPRPWIKLGVCFYHSTHGKQATKCEPPCAWESGS